MRKNNLLKAILFFLIAFTILGCRNEFNSIDDIRENSRAKEFFSRQQNANNKNSDAEDLLPVLEKINNKNEFLSKLSDQKGIPVWENAFSKSFEHKSKHAHDDHAHEMLYVPLINPEKKHLTSILFVENPDDENPKVYSITNDELLEYVNNKEIKPKERESMLLTFLAIDNQIFGDRKYSNIPNQLFENIKTKENFKSFTIKQKEESGTHSKYVMSCVDVYHCEGCQGPCDECGLCVSKYCSYIWGGGGSGSGAGDGGTSGTGNPGGGTGTGSSNNTPWYLMNPNLDVYAYNTNVRGIFKSFTDFGIVLDEEHMDFLQANTTFSNAIKNCLVNNTGYKAVFVYNLLNEILISNPQPDLNALASKLNTFYNPLFNVYPKATLPLFNKLFIKENITLAQFNSWFLNPNGTPNLNFESWFITKSDGQDGIFDNVSEQLFAQQTFQQHPLPSMANYELAFPSKPNSTYPSYYRDAETNTIVYNNYVGGNLKLLFNQNGGDIKGNPFRNACAVRQSYTHNKLGIMIPFQHIDLTGSNNWNYIMTASKMGIFLEKTYGAPTHRLIGADANDFKKITEFLKGKTGIYLVINNDSSKENGAGYTGHTDMIKNGYVSGGANVEGVRGGIKYIYIWQLN